MRGRAVAVLVGMALLLWGAGMAQAAEPRLLVDVAWLKGRRHDYRQGHVPGALHVSVDAVRVAVSARRGGHIPRPSTSSGSRT
jgi:hypothetical protein